MSTTSIPGDTAHDPAELGSTDEKAAVTAPPTQPPAPAPVEGGFAGWLTVFGAFWGLFATFGQLNTFGSFQAYYVQNQLAGYTPSEVSWIGSLQLWVFFFSGAFIGRLFDAYGPRRLILAGTLVYTFSLMMTSLCTRYYQFILAQGILLGIGSGLVFYPAVSSTQTHFVRLRATASTAAVSGSSVGGVVFPLVLQQLFPRVGFGWAVRVTGFIGLACNVIAVVCCTSRLPPRKPGPLFQVDLVKDAKFLTFAAGTSIASFGLFVPYFYISQHAELGLHISSDHAFDLLSIMNAGSVFGRLIPGIVADHVGRYNTIIPFTIVSGILCLASWLTARSFGALIAFAVLYGFASGGLIGLTPPCIAQISQVQQIGRRVGLLYAILSFPFLVSGPIAGAILSRQHGVYDGLIIWSGVMLIVGGIIIVGVKVQINSRLAAKA
ncbi:MFS general substrate transporter [Exidia glandulosa HHB12029]|uniref:MFS general substrate transporter n=1 Tax=Exidia glandulosa HHB12029 TaxID=1314781 RepID=A0A165EKF2_EXIGL|nr:MFS general substrate transporter [Exidia glandulosa HHB12029]